MMKQVDLQVPDMKVKASVLLLIMEISELASPAGPCAEV